MGVRVTPPGPILIKGKTMTHEEWLSELKFRYSGIGNWRKYHWEIISDPKEYDKLINFQVYEWFFIEIMVRK